MRSNDYYLRNVGVVIGEVIPLRPVGDPVIHQITLVANHIRQLADQIPISKFG